MMLTMVEHGHAERTPPVFELDDDELLSVRNRGMFREVVGFQIEFFERCDSLALRFVDRHNHVVANFPWWDDVDRDLRTWDMSDVPLGDVSSPYTDSEQCWRILIWWDTDRVYIAESDGDMNFHGLYWVLAADYRNAWGDALTRVRATP